MSKGLFDLSGFENMHDDDIMSMSINESVNEFESGSPADPTKHFDSANSGDHNVSVPGKAVLDEDTYNDALKRLKQSFKEGYEVLDMLQNADVLAESAQTRQKNFTYNAILESFENGPLFEKVERSDKDEVKDIVAKIRKNISKAVHEEDVEFRTPSVWGDILTGAFLYNGTVPRAFQTIWSMRLWQIIGAVYVEDGKVDKLCEVVTDKFSKELGGYKIIPVKTYKSVADMFRTSFGWKDQRSIYFIIVDKKLPAEIKEMQKKLEAEVEKAKED